MEIKINDLRKGDIIELSVNKEIQFGPMIMRSNIIWRFLVKKIYFDKRFGNSISFYTDIDNTFWITLPKDHTFFHSLVSLELIKRLNFWKRLFL